MHNSVTTNVCTNLFTMHENNMVPIHGKKMCESDRNQKDMGFQKSSFLFTHGGLKRDTILDTIHITKGNMINMYKR